MLGYLPMFEVLCWVTYLCLRSSVGLPIYVGGPLLCYLSMFEVHGCNSFFLFWTLCYVTFFPLADSSSMTNSASSSISSASTDSLVCCCTKTNNKD